MAAWLVTNFLWIGILLAVLAVGLKIALGVVLKRLMDRSAAEAACRGDSAARGNDPNE